MKNKEFLYVGHYVDTNGNYILKIGTTNDLKRRQQEHTRNYRRNKLYQLPKEEQFIYDWHLPLSKYNTLRYEDRNRKKFISEQIGSFVRNDRFDCGRYPPATVTIKIRKEYIIKLKGVA